MKSLYSLTASLFFTILFLATCNNSEKKTSTSQPDSNHYSTTHAFSDKQKQDVFDVKLTGNKPENMYLLFTITSHTGNVIYEVNIKGTDLLGSTDPNVDLRKEADQINFIKMVAKEFLDEEHFLVPAVTSEQTADDYTPDKPFYAELKSSGLNGFAYRLGKENNLYIAWSEKEQKVKLYYNCC